MNKKIVTRIIISILASVLVLSTRSINTNNNKTDGEWIDYTGNGDWCFKYSDGHWAANEYIDNYWIDSAGWYNSSWNGYWDKNNIGWWYASGSWYPTNEWLKINGVWYYFKSNGYMAANEWVGNYYVDGNGAMVTNSWVGEYYVGADGAWIPGYTELKKDNAPANNSSSNSSSDNTNSNSNSSNTNTNTNTNANTSNNNSTNNNSSNNSSTDKPTSNTTTKTKVYTVFDPHFHCEFESETIAKDANGGDDYSKGWYNYNYIVCNTCGKKYNSYAEYRKNDTCNIVTFTENDTYTLSKAKGGTTMSMYNYYFDYCKKYMGCVEYQYKAQVVCHCGAQFDSYDEWNKHSAASNHNGWSILDGKWGITDQCKTYEETHYPELISEKEQ